MNVPANHADSCREPEPCQKLPAIPTAGEKTEERPGSPCNRVRPGKGRVSGHVTGGLRCDTGPASRREFLGWLPVAAAGLTVSWTTGDLVCAEDDDPGRARPRVVRFGLIADVHHHLAPDAEARLEAFMREAEQRELDFLLQLGDFTHRPRHSTSLYQTWEGFGGPRYHVLGNHDMDHEPKRATLDAWEMERGFYSFDTGGFHVVVLDANHLRLDDRYVDYDRGNYFQHPQARGHISPEQLQWLSEDLKQSVRPTLVFSHQALDGHASVANADTVRAVLNRHNHSASAGRVVACLCGHHHIDDLQSLEGIHFLQINSASYHWVGSTYSDNGMATYRDPLFAFVTLDPAGTLSIEGRKSEFVPPTPHDMRHPDADQLTAAISNRRLEFAS